ncbi:MAG TPA: alpha/beta hydrolase [Streptosporangiaceae bacterium]|jgi:pimeloyl-ACP methyl ester carboxylesterase|nr:alpha/beta hydrolase [Streptosporangiaceae bacterium]
MNRPSATQARLAPPIPVWPGRLVTVGAAEVFLRAAPAEPGAQPALCVHGLGGSSTNWTDLMDLLRRPDQAPGASMNGAEGLDPAWPRWPGGHPLACEALDMPGHGHSPPARDGDYSVSAQARLTARLIERRGRGPVHLIGNSLGGAVCTKLAASRPDLIKTLTLISPALPDLRPRTVPARISAVRIPGLGIWMMRRAAKFPARQRVAVTLRDVYYDPEAVHPDRLAEEIAEVERRDTLGYVDDALLKSASGVVSEYFRRGPAALWREAAQITADVLVIHGSHDRLVDPRMAARAARTFQHVRVVVLPKTGHVAMMERPVEVVREMRIMMTDAARRAAGLPALTTPSGEQTSLRAAQ